MMEEDELKAAWIALAWKPTWELRWKAPVASVETMISDPLPSVLQRRWYNPAIGAEWRDVSVVEEDDEQRADAWHPTPKLREKVKWPNFPEVGPIIGQLQQEWLNPVTGERKWRAVPSVRAWCDDLGEEESDVCE